MEVIAYIAKPIECTGARWQLTSLMLDGSYIYYPQTGKQEEIYKLANTKNRELIKSS